MSDPVLKDVRVLEIGGGIPVAFAARWLAGFGADVVRLDPAEESLTTDEQVYLLAGKRRVAPTSDPRALALAADIVIEGDNPGDIVKHLRRVQPEALRARKPGLVVVSITPFGQDGPYAGFEASNITSFAMGGIMSLTGMPQREPLVTGGSQALYLGGLNGFGAAVTAYLGSLIHGEGDWVDISLQECMAGMLELYGPGGAYNGTASMRAGNHVRASWGSTRARTGLQGVRARTPDPCALQRRRRPGAGGATFSGPDAATEPRRRAAGEVLRVVRRPHEAGDPGPGGDVQGAVRRSDDSGRPARQREPGGTPLL
ncbi:MAG: CoA transferase [Dehalococcoidia bacterium]|nr:CoA transferase [Dehalococcoidia bacterium]